MISLLNPKNLFPLLKYYFTDPVRLWKLTPKEIKEYKDKAFRKIVKYAYTVPLYHDKYKKAGVHPSDIKKIEDINKLPFITKEDINSYFPKGIVPVNYNIKKAYVSCTGGSSGKPLNIYYDFLLNVRSGIISLRSYRFCNLDWRKNRFAVVGEFNVQNRVGAISRDNLLPKIKAVYSAKNLLYIDINNTVEDIIKKLDEFQPDSIHSYPSGLQFLAYNRKKGYGKNINPKVLTVSGAILDDYTRNYVEDAFGCRVLNYYASVEAGSNISMECLYGSWHINDDLFHVEAIDEQGNLVPKGNTGKIVLTRLWGTGTPIIRYVGMDDWIKISSDKECSCGLRTSVFIDGVNGKISNNIILPNGKILPSSICCGSLASVLYSLKTFKVKQYQIVQRTIDRIDILVVIDDDLKEAAPSVDHIFKKIKEAYEAMVGDDVKIDIIEVEEIKKAPSSIKPPPLVISHLRKEEIPENLKINS